MCSFAHHLLACVYMCWLSMLVGKIRKTFNYASDKKSTIIPALEILCSTSSITTCALCEFEGLGIVLMFGWKWDDEKRTKNAGRRQKEVHIHMSDDNGKRKKGKILSFGSDLDEKFSTRTFNAWNFLLVFNFPRISFPWTYEGHTCSRV